MNFVNTMVVNVSTRRYELAILESVGMTKRQIKRMLSMEGCYYWGVSFSLVATIGTAIYIMLYVIFSKVAFYAVFSYPLIPLVLVSRLVLLICVIVPIWTYKADIKLTVVERLRISEKG
jgi:putative ABC transport system permease protein